MATNPDDTIRYGAGRGYEAPSTVTPIPGVAPPDVVRPNRYPTAIGICALLALLVSAWGGIASFVGPAFGFRPDGGGSLTWNLARALLAVAPGVGGVLGSLLILALSGQWQLRSGRRGLVVGAELVALSGAWFAIGFVAWPVLEGSRYLVGAGGLRGFDDVLGVAIGPGVLLVAFAATVLGFLFGARAAYRVDDALFATPAGAGGPRLVESPEPAFPPAATPEGD